MSSKTQTAECKETQQTIFSVGNFKESFFALYCHKDLFYNESFPKLLCVTMKPQLLGLRYTPLKLLDEENYQMT